MKTSTDTGFTLIETLIAAAILAMGSAAIASLFVSSIRLNVYSRERANAMLLAADKMEQLRLAAGSGDGEDVVVMPGTSFIYRRAWHISGSESRTILLTISAHERELGRLAAVVGAQW